MAGPPFELPPRLCDEHLEPSQRAAAGSTRVGEQLRLWRVVDEVVHERPRERSAWKRRAVDVGPGADWRSVDEDIPRICRGRPRGRLDAKLASPQYAQVAQSLREIGFNSAIELFATYAGQPTDLAGWLADAQINYDRNLRLQYLAGMGLNLYQSGPIYAEILRHKKYPEGLFTGSPETLQRLRAAIASAPGGDAQTQ